jgi:hypothetical protein
MAKRAKPKRKPAKTASRRPAGRRPAAPHPAGRHPAESDFDVVVQVGKGTVSVLFRPTNSHYLFAVVANPDAKPRAGAKPHADVELRAGAPGHSDSYVESEIFEMSAQLASAAVRDVFA